ncbi:MAG: hypothetical protein EOO48_01590 [Flavobacterium sp.]|nr:MAG: hypothetical protein EOO48_01590 [Flavobacterium sp.]
MSKNLFIRQLDAMESKTLIDASQSKAILKITAVLVFAFGVSLIFKDNILSVLRHHPQELTVSHKNMQAVKIATAE